MSAILQAGGQLMEGSATQAAQNYNAATERQNAAMAVQQAAAQAGQTEQENRRKMGSIVAAYGASGVQVGTGTPLQVMHDAATQGELSRRLELYKGDVESAAKRTQAQLDIAKGKAAKTASYFAAGSTILTGAAKAASGGGKLSSFL